MTMAMAQQRTRESGFSIIELVLVIGLMTILLLALLNLFDWHNKMYLLEMADTRATGSARHALNNMSVYVAQASQVVASRTVGGTTYTTGSQTLVVQLPSFNSSGNLINNTNDYAVYYLSGSSLYQIIETGTGSARPAGTKLLSSDVDTFNIAYDDGNPTLANKVTVSLYTKVSVRPGTMAKTQVSSTIYLRNR